MNFQRFSLKAIACLTVAADTAEHYHQPQIQVPHILIGLLVSGSQAGQLLQSHRLTLEHLGSLNSSSNEPISSKTFSEQTTSISPEVINILKQATELALSSKSPLITSMHILAAALGQGIPNNFIEKSKPILAEIQPLLKSTWLREPGLLGPEFTRDEALQHLVNWARTDKNWQKNLYTFCKSSGINQGEIAAELALTRI